MIHIFKRKEGGLKKLVSVLMVFAVFFLAISTSLTAQNETNSTGLLLSGENNG